MRLPYIMEDNLLPSKFPDLNVNHIYKVPSQ